MKSNRPVPDSCPFCASIKTEFWFEYSSDIDKLSYSIFECSRCKSSFVFPAPTEEYLSKFYSGDKNSHGGSFFSWEKEKNYEYILAKEKEYPNSVIDAARIALKARHYSSGNHFLDVGCGFGFFTNEALKKGFECTAIEAGGNNCDIFEKMNGFRPIQAVLNQQFVEENAGSFDVILLSQVLEHIPDPVEAVVGINRLLKPNGLCIVAVPHFGSLVSFFQGKRDMFICPPEHLSFFSAYGLKSLFLRNGLDCIEFHTVSRFDKKKVHTKFKQKVIPSLVCGGLDLFLKFSDTTNRGMFLNAYFRKVVPC